MSAIHYKTSWLRCFARLGQLREPKGKEFALPGEHQIGEPVPSSELAAAQGGADAPQSLSFAFFAGLATAAILIVALAAPMVFDRIAGPLFSALGTSREAVGAGAITWYHLLSFQIAVVLLVVLMAGVARGQAPGLGWQAPVGRLSWVQPLLVTIAVSIVTAIIAFAYFADIIERDLAPIRRLIEAAPLWMAFVALVFGAPLSEELLFRGFLLHRLQQTRLGFWGAAVIANIGWTLLHFSYSWLSLADVFLAGLLFSWALWRTRSIWVPISFHALYNATVFFVLLIPSPFAPALW